MRSGRSRPLATMAPAVVKMVAMPDAFEDSSKPPTTAPRSPANLLFPRAEPYRPPKAAQDAHINLLTYTREPPTRPFMSTGLASAAHDGLGEKKRSLFAGWAGRTRARGPGWP